MTAMLSHTQYAPAVHAFTTPRGNAAKMHFRLDTNDWNTLTSAITEDEYRLGELPPLSGVAIDIGAHIGSVTIMLALDNPNIRIISVEPVPANVALVVKNIIENNVGDRVDLAEAAAGGPNDKRTVVDWGYVGEPHLEHHAFIGNTALVHEFGSNPTVPFQKAEVECYSLSRLRWMAILGSLTQDRITLLKIDCEGCEWRALADPAVDKIDMIIGEWHNVPAGDLKPQRRTIAGLLSNHDVSFTGPEAGPGGFRAVYRGSSGRT